MMVNGEHSVAFSRTRRVLGTIRTRPGVSKPRQGVTEDLPAGSGSSELLPNMETGSPGHRKGKEKKR
jgi:hypothetical protein